MKVPTDEQETVIQFDRNGTVAHIDTTDSIVMTKLDKLVAKSDKWTVEKEHYSLEHELIGKCYQTDKNLISFKADKRKLTDEQKRTMAEHFHKSTSNGNS